MLILAAPVFIVGLGSRNITALNVTAGIMAFLGVITGNPIYIAADLFAVGIAYLITRSIILGKSKENIKTTSDKNRDASTSPINMMNEIPDLKDFKDKQKEEIKNLIQVLLTTDDPKVNEQMKLLIIASTIHAEGHAMDTMGFFENKSPQEKKEWVLKRISNNLVLSDLAPTQPMINLAFHVWELFMCVYIKLEHNGIAQGKPLNVVNYAIIKAGADYLNMSHSAGATPDICTYLRGEI